MKVTQTIELSDDERAVLGKALHLIDRIADIADVSMADAFDYIVDNSDPTDGGKCYYVMPLHNIKEMKGEE